MKYLSSFYRFLCVGLCFALPFVMGVLLATPVLAVPHAKAQLVFPDVEPKAGESYTMGVEFKIDPGWHIYWKNAGEAGFPPQFEWSTDMEQPYEWPVPKTYVLGGVLGFVYDGDPILLFRKKWEKGEVPDSLSVRISWLECADICIPQEMSLSVDFPLASSDQRIQPGRIEQAVLTAQSYQTLEVWPEENEGQWSWVVPISHANLKSVYWFPEEQTVDVSLPHRYSFLPDGTYTRVEVPFGLDQQTWKGVLKVVRVDGGVEGYRLVRAKTARQIVQEPDQPDEPDKPDEPEAPDEPDGVTTNQGVPVQEDGGDKEVEDVPIIAVTQDRSIWAMIGLAFLGGLILNLMPCVFPVLAFKVLHLVKQQDSFLVRLRHNIAYAFGVLGTFWGLALTIGVFQRFGMQLGWGFQLQSPVFVGGLTLLMMMITFHLWGLNQMPLSLVSGMSKWSSGGASDRRMSNVGMGVLSVVMASPCTAPFMAVAIGFALTQSLGVILAVFSALGVGFVLPMVMLSLSDTLMNRLPKPGAWMVTFKRIIGVPMMMTAGWLGWVFWTQTSGFAMCVLWVSVVLLGVMGWGLMRVFSMEGSVAKRPNLMFEWVGWFIVLLIVFGVLWRVSIQSSHDPKPVVFRDQILSYRQEGKPVLVDVTADWCLTCKVNERMVLYTPDIQAFLSERDVQLVVVDWTEKNDDIMQYLRAFGMSGVPLMVYYPPGKPYRILPQILTKDILKKTIER